MMTPGIRPINCRRTIINNIHFQTTKNILNNYFFFIIIFLIFIISTFFVDFTNAQLNDPITQYIEGRLGNRRIFWCPSGYGYLAYCPQPTDWDNYNWCCTWPYMGSWKPSCCPFALPTGAVVAIIIASIILVAVLVGLSCWCCFCCPLYKKLYEYEDDDDFVQLPQSNRQQSQQQQPIRYSSNR